MDNKEYGELSHDVSHTYKNTFVTRVPWFFGGTFGIRVVQLWYNVQVRSLGILL